MHLKENSWFHLYNQVKIQKELKKSNYDNIFKLEIRININETQKFGKIQKLIFLDKILINQDKFLSNYFIYISFNYLYKNKLISLYLKKQKIKSPLKFNFEFLIKCMHSEYEKKKIQKIYLSSFCLEKWKL